jgi:hypothetical protein
MGKYGFAVVGMMIFASTAHAGPDCQELMRAYEIQGKSMSLESAEVIGDNSVYRAILKEMKINNLNIARQMNLSLMVSQRCPLPETPVVLNEYMMDALKCATEQTKGNYRAPECDFAKWNKIANR